MHLTTIIRTIIFAALIAIGAGAQSTLTVPGSHATIQSAITAAFAGDTILVSPGSHFGNIDFLGKSITVRSTAGPESTVLDGNGSGTVVRFSTSGGAPATIEGFTIQNGVGTIGSSSGVPIGFAGGIQVDSNASVTINDCRILSNQGGAGAANSLGGAGGVQVNSSAPVMIARCVIANNQGGPGGAGVAQQLGLGFVGGNAGDGGAGGLGFGNASDALVENCFVANNIGGSGGFGAILSGGAGGDGGAGGFELNVSSITIFHASVAGNQGGTAGVSFTSPGLAGPGGVHAYLSSFTMANSIVWGNTGIAFREEFLSLPSISFCDIEGGHAGPGIFDEDPLFLNVAGSDLHLLAGSPCIDAGDSSIAGLPVVDFDGDLRSAGSLFDIGADEAESTVLAELPYQSTGALGALVVGGNSVVLFDTVTGFYFIDGVLQNSINNRGFVVVPANAGGLGQPEAFLTSFDFTDIQIGADVDVFVQGIAPFVLLASGDADLAGDVFLDGASGGSTSDGHGGGGGAGGGAIAILVNGNISITGRISACGGNGGFGDESSGLGMGRRGLASGGGSSGGLGGPVVAGGKGGGGGDGALIGLETAWVNLAVRLYGGGGGGGGAYDGPGGCAGASSSIFTLAGSPAGSGIDGANGTCPTTASGGKGGDGSVSSGTPFAGGAGSTGNGSAGANAPQTGFNGGATGGGGGGGSPVGGLGGKGGKGGHRGGGGGGGGGGGDVCGTGTPGRGRHGGTGGNGAGRGGTGSGGSVVSVNPKPTGGGRRRRDHDDRFPEWNGDPRRHLRHLRWRDARREWRPDGDRELGSAGDHRPARDRDGRRVQRCSPRNDDDRIPPLRRWLHRAGDAPARGRRWRW